VPAAAWPGFFGDDTTRAVQAFEDSADQYFDSPEG
jgi:hypothetical protein